MKHLLFVCVLLSFSPFYLFSQTNKSDTVLTWSDEFDGTGVPDTSKWDRPEYNRRSNSNGPDGYWSQEDSYLDGNGNLIIRVRKIFRSIGNRRGKVFEYGALGSVKAFLPAVL